MNKTDLLNVKNRQLKILADYIVKRCETDEYLNNKILETKKTMFGCYRYLENEARKLLDKTDGCNMSMISDEETYELCVHYFLEDSLDFEPKEAKPVKNVEKVNSNKNKNNLLTKAIDSDNLFDDDAESSDIDNLFDNDIVDKTIETKSKSSVSKRVSIFDLLGE